MEILVKRKYKKDSYTIGELYINGKFFCHTMEDKDRGLTQNMPLAEIKKRKVYAKTAIPSGTYKITMDVRSPKFSNYAKYPNYKRYGGRLPRLLNVPGFEGILIHIGNDASWSAGCLLVGMNTVKGKVMQSTETFHKLMSELLKDRRNITITIE